MLNSLVKIVINSPVYPHWLEHLKMRQGNNMIIKSSKGKVNEVGAGDGSRKVEIISKNSRIQEYIATDYSSWDDEFEKLGRAEGLFGKLVRTFMGRQERVGLDAVCSATKLPYKNGTFDTHLSFEVLEHIQDPKEYFKEASRVVRSKGKIMFSVPFLYREHKMDYFRYTGDFFEMIAEENGLKLIKKYSNTGYGTTMGENTNQWLIRRVVEGPLILRPLLLVISPLVFLCTNLIGWLIDLNPDIRFSIRYHIIFQKK